MKGLIIAWAIGFIVAILLGIRTTRRSKGDAGDYVLMVVLSFFSWLALITYLLKPKDYDSNEYHQEDPWFNEDNLYND